MNMPDLSHWNGSESVLSLVGFYVARKIGALEKSVMKLHITMSRVLKKSARHDRKFRRHDAKLVKHDSEIAKLKAEAGNELRS